MEYSIVDEFFDDSNLYLLSPYIDSHEQKRILDVWKGVDCKNSVFIMSSGTTSGSGTFKSYVIPKESILNNAKMVNDHFGFTQSDIWLASLPYYHIGGLSIHIRAHLAKSGLVMQTIKWNPAEFVNLIQERKVSICSLVPTQLYDIISHKLKAPKTLKSVFIGGDYLNTELGHQANKLGWPLIVTYGMTETSSQIASSYFSNMKNGYIELLKNYQIKQKGNEVSLKSNTLFSHEVLISKDNALITKSSAEFYLKDNIDTFYENGITYLRPLGRSDDFIKIKGRLYNFLDIKEICLNQFTNHRVYHYAIVVLEQDKRDGKSLKIIYLNEAKDIIQSVVEKINQELPKALNIKSTELVGKIDKTELGKVKKI